MGIEELLVEGNLVFGLAKISQVFVIDSMVYYANHAGNAGSNTFKLKDRKLFLVNSLPIEILERMSRDNLKNLIDDYKKSFITNQLKSRDYNINTDYERLVRFVVNDIFGCLRKQTGQKLNELLGVPQSEEEKNLEYKQNLETFLQNFKTLLRGNGQEAEKKLDSILFSGYSRSIPCNSVFLELTRGYNFAIYDDKTNYLIERKKGPLKINGITYSLTPTYSLQDFKNSFSSELLKRISLEAVDDILKDKEFMETNAEKEFFKKLSSQNHYHEQDFGFEKTGDECVFVYVDVPTHVLKSPHNGNLYKFDGHKLGVCIKVAKENGDFLVTAHPHSSASVSGPFYSDENNLCMGSSYNRDYLSNAGKHDSMTKGEAFAKYLID